LRPEGQGPITALHFSPDCKRLAIAAGNEVLLFDANTGAARGRLTGHSSPVAGVAFRADGGALLSRTHDGEVRLWDTGTGKQVLSLRGRPTLLAIGGLEPDGKVALTHQSSPRGGPSARILRRWDLATGREIGRLEAVASNTFFSSDQLTRLTLDFEAGIRLLDPATSKERFRLPFDSRLQEPQLAFSSDGKRVALVARESSPATVGWKGQNVAVPRVLQVWDLPAGRLLASFRGYFPETWRPQLGYAAAAGRVAFSRDNRLLALVEMDAAQAAGRILYLGAVRVLDLATGKAGPAMKPDQVTSLAFSADGKLLATGDWEKLHLWDVAGGKEVRTLAHHRGQRVHVVGFAADDSLLVLYLETPRQLGPDSKEESYELVLWDPATDQLRASLKGARLPAIISPNGRSVVAVVGNGASWSGHVIQVWDVFTAQQRAMLRGHRSSISELHFTPNGETLISHGWDNILQWQSAWPNPAEQHYLDGIGYLWKGQQKLQNFHGLEDLNLNLVPAAKSFVKALESRPDHRGAYAGLARVLSVLEKLPVPNPNGARIRSDVIAALRRLVESCPDRAEARFLLASALEGDSAAEPLEQYRQTIRCDSKHAEAHARIGYLSLAGQHEDDALAAFRHVVEIDSHSLETALRAGDPVAPHALRQVARLFERHGRWADAAIVHRRRVAAAPNDLPCQLDLAHALRRSGQMADAMSAYRRCQQLGGKTEMHSPERWSQLERKLPADLHSRIESGDADELLALAELSLFKLRAPTAARCYAAALAANPKLPERFHAACAAVLAGTKADKESAGLTDAERAAWLQQARDWLRAELAAQQKALQADARQASASVYSILSSWRTEVDLSPVRDRLEGSHLPKEEQAAWTAFWSDAEVIRRWAAFVPTGLWWVDGTEIAQEEKIAAACWLWLGDTRWTDYDLEVEAQRVDGSEGFAVGFRMADSDNLLAANFGGWSNQRTGVEVKTEGDVKIHWASMWPQSIEAGRWYRVRVHARGDRFTVLLDDTEILSLTEHGHPHGAVGLHSWNTANRFRNLKVTDPRGKVLFEGLPVIQVANRSALATVLGQRGRYTEAAELFAAAAAASPQTLDRYNAACCSVRAGTEARDRTEEARRRFRARAYDWLHAELEARRDAFEKSPSISTARDMAYWEQDADFHAVRAAPMLARLPATEARRWKRLWSEVAELRRRGEWFGCRKTWKIEGTELVQESERGEFMLLFGDPKWTDYDVQLEAKPTRGSGEVNVVVRAASLYNLTVAILGGWDNSRHGIMPLAGVQWNAIATAVGKTTIGQWHKVKVEVRGRTCQLFVDGSFVVRAEGIPAAAGQVGLRTFNSAGRFRNIKIRDPKGKVLFEGLPELPR
jgi:WD40 repeat protein/tetratricopeptide (TPR) repeat protein